MMAYTAIIDKLMDVGVRRSLKDEICKMMIVSLKIMKVLIHMMKENLYQLKTP